ncbi:MAG: signal peptidase I [Planctomycetota bacterium]|jgi:signal peptidase I
MSQTEQQQHETVAHTRAGEIANTFEWLIIAFLLAFVVRAFIIEPFRIPTGSMAHTLMGIHFRLRCKQCGYRYEHGIGNYNVPQDIIPAEDVDIVHSRCPSCGCYQLTGGNMPISNGDRILVLKSLYQFVEPKRWDVIVFKNPLDPSVNYIKRLIGLPGDQVEIIDGDVYINGEISRKPPRVQRILWMPVYDNDYRPVKPDEKMFNPSKKWVMPFNLKGSKWRIDQENPTVFTLDSDYGSEQEFVYDVSEDSSANSFRTTYAYNNTADYRYFPICSDLMTRFYAEFHEHGRIGIALSKYNILYRAWVDLDGKLSIARVDQGAETILAAKAIDTRCMAEPVLVKFANIDHQLIFEFGNEKLKYDFGVLPDSAGERIQDAEPEVRIFGFGKLRISHVALFRDIYYTETRGLGRAYEGKPFDLKANQFFVLGDNSPDSHDGRSWSGKGIGNNGTRYDEGIVPRDYLMGKALMVYWPSSFQPLGKNKKVVMPDVGQIRLIYGGSD